MANSISSSLSEFGPLEYERILTGLINDGYSFVNLAGINSDLPHVFLRHDIDLCPARALEIAQREAAIGVKATYYFLVSTNLYSVASAGVRRVMQEIVGLGHEIGLHFDVEQYSQEAVSLDAVAERECEILALCSGAQIESISFHRPTPQFLNRQELIAGRRHCYEPSFFSHIGYISDSNGGWHHGHPLDHPAVRERRAIQLLTHPIWWCNDVQQSAVATIEQLFSDRRQELQAALAGTVTAYRDALAGMGSR